MKPSPIFEFFIYSVYRLRGEEAARCKVFRVFAPGHYLAICEIASFDEQQEILNMIQANKLDLFFKSVKRKGINAHDEELRGFKEFVTDFQMTDNQLDFMTKNRVQLR